MTPVAIPVTLFQIQGTRLPQSVRASRWLLLCAKYDNQLKKKKTNLICIMESLLKAIITLQ